MTVTDLLIVYLAFGAPLAVYKYLQNRAADVRRRVVLSTFTFFFWIPTAVEIVYLYTTNAYSGDGFVSQRRSDADYARLSGMRESISTELIRLARGSNLHDLRETVDRYVGLADTVRVSGGQKLVRHELFDVAGREEGDLGSICLTRRNLRRLERHHTQAREDFVNLLGRVSGSITGRRSVSMGIEIARQLDDDETVQQLSDLEMKRGEVWKSEQQDKPRAATGLPPIAMTASLNND